MFKVVAFLALVAFACAGPAALNPDLNEPWEEFKVRYGKSYSTVAAEIARRMIFEQNVKKIQQHNLEYDLGKKSYFLGINKFADNTHEEFMQFLKPFTLKAKTGATYLPPSNVGDDPASVDWRTKGYVTPIKNQGQCGSCWAFSATGSLEGQHFKKDGQLVSLSEQNLVDCSGNWGNNGCEGGLMDNAFQYIHDNKGIDTESSYPYEAVDATCRFKAANVGATLTTHTDIPTGNEDALKSAVATVGPISVAIDASQDSFQLYSGGVYDEPACSSTQLDHGVLAVGYGTTTDGVDFWLVKNSWGTDWGMKGYINMSRNKNNQCGIATMSSYPIV